MSISLNLSEMSDTYILRAHGGFALCRVAPAVAITGADDAEAIEELSTPESGRRFFVDRFADALPVNPLASRFLGREVRGTVVIDRKG